jgi:hypothetical protein
VRIEKLLEGDEAAASLQILHLPFEHLRLDAEVERVNLTGGHAVIQPYDGHFVGGA